MKSILSILFLGLAVTYAQRSEDLVPHQAVTVFSLNNINLLQHISLDDLVKYEFMEELQQELFDGSTSGKTIKDSGIDFDQKLNVFNGKGEKYTVNGFTFGVLDKDKLFETFDDFAPVETDVDGLELYVSYFNRIAIKGNSGILFRIAPTMRLVDEITDSIWYARGNEYPWYNEEFQELFDEYGTEEEPISPDMETEENTITPDTEYLPIADEDPDEKTYYELRDSVDFALQEQFIEGLITDLFVNNRNLIKESTQFKSQLEHKSEAVLYADNSRRIKTDDEFWYLKSLYPGLFYDVSELYENNITLGDLNLSEGLVAFKIELKYSEALGSIYQQLTNSKFDANIAKYISKDASAFFTYNVNMKEAYKKTIEVMTPIMEKSDDQNVAADLLIMELFDILMDEETVFDTYKGSMFGTYSDIKKVKTKKIVFEYDEENFEYREIEVEAEEDMPIFSLGFSTGRTDILERILKRMTKINPDIRKEKDFWMIDNAILGSVPMYLLLKNDLLIVSNDEMLATTYSNGYGSNVISKSVLKKAKTNGAMYARIDMDEAISRLPKEIFSERENNVLDVVRNKNGVVELTSSKSTKTNTVFDLNYTYDSNKGDSNTFILDLINSIYVISK